MTLKISKDMLGNVGPFTGGIVSISSPIDTALQLIIDAVNLKETQLPNGTAGQYIRGDRTLATLGKAAVGLPNVDNTSDANKPISTATQTALNAKEPSLPTGGNTGHYLRGDKTWVTLGKVAVGLSEVDNTSDANKPVSTAVQAALDLKAPLASPTFTGTVTVSGSQVETRAARGAANGYAPLGSDGKIPSINLPDNGSYKGNWNASTNSPTIVAGTGTNGDTYTVSVAGTQSVTGSSVAFAVGDQIRFTTNGNKWERIPNSQAVSSVAGLTGTIVNSDLRNALNINLVDNTSDADKPVSTATASAITSSAATRQPLNSNLTSIAALTTTSYGRSFLDRVDAPAGRALLGLGNIDNTSDINKPVSTATQLAIDAKNASNITAADVDGISSTIQTELSKSLILVRNTPTLDWKTGESAAAATARATAFLANVAAYGGGRVSNGLFSLNPISFNADGTIELSEGAVLDFSANTASTHRITLGSDTLVSLPLLAADVVRGSNSFTFASDMSTYLSPGDWFIFYNPTNFSWLSGDEGREYYREGEWLRVWSVTGNVVQTDASALHDYPYVNLLAVKPVTRNIKLVGGHIIGAEGSALATTVLAWNLKDSEIDISTAKATRAALELRRSVNTFASLHMSDYGPNNSLNGGLGAIACHKLTVTGSDIRTRRHAVSFTGGEITASVPNRYAYVTDSYICGASFGFDTHSPAEFCGARNCTIEGGVILGGDKVDVENCTIRTLPSGGINGGRAIAYRERKGLNTRIINTTVHIDGTLTSTEDTYIVDITAPFATDYGGHTELDITIYTNKNQKKAVRIKGAPSGTTNQFDLTSKVIVINEDATFPSPDFYIDNSGGQNWRNVRLNNYNISTQTSTTFVCKNLLVSGTCNAGADGARIYAGSASFPQKIRIEDMVVSGNQKSGIYINSVGGNTADVDVVITQLDSRNNGTLTSADSSERVAISLNGVKKAYISDCVLGDEQSVTTQVRSISALNCGTVVLNGLERVGAIVSDTFTGTTMVAGRNFRQDRLVRTNTTNISSGVTTVASGAAFEELSGTINVDRSYLLSSTGAVDGYRRRIVKTGGGSGNWLIGSLFSLGNNQWCLIEFDYATAAWKLIASGDLISRRQWTEYYSANADPSSSLTSLNNGTTYIFTGTLTAARSVTLSTSGALQYDRKRFINNGTNYWWNIGGLFSLLPGEECTVEFDGAAWVLIRYPKGTTSLVNTSPLSLATGVGTSEVSLTVVPFPPMGPNDCLIIESAWSYGNSSTSKQPRIRLGTSSGGFSIYSPTLTTTTQAFDRRIVANRNATNVQRISQAGGTVGTGTSTGALLAGSYETSAGGSIYFGATPNSTDDVSLDYYKIEILRR